ncbi:MAG: hypothetical protein ABI333_09515 [bacterium]
MRSPIRGAESLAALLVLSWSCGPSGPPPRRASTRFTPPERDEPHGRKAPPPPPRASSSSVRSLVESEGNRFGIGLCVVRADDTATCGCVVSADPDHPPMFKIIPRPVARYTGVRAIAPAGDHRCTLKADGTVWCRGSNKRGQLGLGHTQRRRLPTLIPKLRDLVSLTTSWRSTCAVRKDGTAWCWGDAAQGQAGDGGKVCGEDDRCAARRLQKRPSRVRGLARELTGVKSVHSSHEFACALKANGRVWCWGNNRNGQLGDGSRSSASVAGRVSALAHVRQLAVDEKQSCAVTRDGKLWCWPLPGRRRVPVRIPGLAQVRHVATGASHVCAIAAGGKVYCWGANQHGQLGDGTTTARPKPTAVPGLTGVTVLLGLSFSTCAARADGTLYCWGAIGQRTGAKRQTVPTPRKVKLIGK